MLRGALREKIQDIHKKIKTRDYRIKEKKEEKQESKPELKPIKSTEKKKILDIEENFIEKASKKWEYRIMMLQTEMIYDGYAKNLLETLNKLGHEGWEVMAVLPENRPHSKTKIFLKREKL